MIRFLAACLCVAGISAQAQAVEFKSVGATPAILYDAPTDKGRKVFIAPRGMPVEIVLAYGDWIKVRDAAGDLSWVDAKQLSSKRMLVVTAVNAKLHGSADDGAPVVMTAERGVLLELSEPVASGWLKVRHRDGITGFVRAGSVWGD